MTIDFSIHFTPNNGEKLYIGLTAGGACSEIAMEYSGNSLWHKSLELDLKEGDTLSYRYFVVQTNGEIYYEAGRMRSMAPGKRSSLITLHDQWVGNTLEAAFLTAPFTDVFFRDEKERFSRTNQYVRDFGMRVIAPNIPNSSTIKIVGNSTYLGEWDPAKALPLQRCGNGRWEIHLPAKRLKGERWEYKFILCSKAGEIIWEEGENRNIEIAEVAENATTMVELSPARFNRPYPRFAGCAVPVFSLRSEKSHGVGDFKDIRLLADWAKATGQSIIQLLPINDTTAFLSWKDSYPYNCISTQALHPLYINLDELGKLKDKRLHKELTAEGKRLNALQYLDYTAVWESKMRYCRAKFEEEKEMGIKEREFEEFCRSNREWLYPYAIFSLLRDLFRSADFTSWGDVEIQKGVTRNCSSFTEELVELFSSEHSLHSDNMEFYLYLQYHLNRQMRKTKQYAHSCGVAIKGDIPIGIARCSVEAWQYPHLFNFSQSAGAPPDFFSRTGQNWGFPTYNWEKMSEDNYLWWKQRLTLFAEYFDAYRIDHILGFFRIWEVPVEYSDGRLGHFSPAMPMSADEIRRMGVDFTSACDMAAGVPADPQFFTPTYDGLFIEDSYKKGFYHPMISAHDGAKYRALPQNQKDAYNALHYNYFYHRHNGMWYSNAMKKLQHLIASTGMLACGEDLGMLADSVIECMNNLKILSLELMIMPKQFGIDLGDPAGYPYLSVCTTSTHDCETLRTWLGNRTGAISGDGCADATPEECTNIIKRNLYAPSMFVILPLQDWLSADSSMRRGRADQERINDPSNSNHYWRFRMMLTLEELISSSDYNNNILSLIRESGR